MSGWIMFHAIWTLAATHHSKVCCGTKSPTSNRFMTNGSGAARGDHDCEKRGMDCHSQNAPLTAGALDHLHNSD